ncbi:MAG: DUF3291 domain-containing protein [Gammaproteobacteria bacterium]|nr:DUF3291 domain-containing protein [Gammaproteobacteria bacterium]
MNRWQLAQLNVARLDAPIDSPQLAGFVEQLDAVNALADAAPGFVWRLMSEAGDAIAVEHPFDSDMIVNMSVWENVDALHAYVYRTAHSKVMARRKEWFDRIPAAYTVLWWVPEGHRPTADEGKRKLALLDANGPTSEAFTFKRVFAMPASSEAEGCQVSSFDDTCPAQ